jgi:hypothetical protein
LEAIARENAWIEKNERSFWRGLLIGLAVAMGVFILLALWT